MEGSGGKFPSTLHSIKTEVKSKNFHNRLDEFPHFLMFIIIIFYVSEIKL